MELLLGLAGGWTGPSAAANTNTDFLINNTYSLLGDKIKLKIIKVFACPTAAGFLNKLQASKAWNGRCRTCFDECRFG